MSGKPWLSPFQIGAGPGQDKVITASAKFAKALWQCWATSRLTRADRYSSWLISQASLRFAFRRSETNAPLVSTKICCAHRFSHLVILVQISVALVIFFSSASIRILSLRRSSVISALRKLSNILSKADLEVSSSFNQPLVSNTIRRSGLAEDGGLFGSYNPGHPRSPPTRLAISIAGRYMSSMQFACMPCVLIEVT